MHLLHGVIVQTQKGDILGHEFCGVVETVGPAVKQLRLSERVVNSFCVSCGECRFCNQGLTTACEKTNASTLIEKMYGDRISGVFGLLALRRRVCRRPGRVRARTAGRRQSAEAPGLDS